MKPLCRLLITISLRLGLFLIVLASVFGQRWHFALETPALQVTLCDHGWLYESIENGRWKLTHKSVNDLLPMSRLFIDWRFDVPDPADDEQGFLTSFYHRSSTVTRYPGVVTIDTEFMVDYSVAVRHWLVILVAVPGFIVAHLMVVRLWKPAKETD